MDAQQLTRQIYWSPSGGLNDILHLTTYLWLGVALVIFSYGIWKHVILWRAGKPEVCFDRPIERTILFFRNVIAQAKVLRSRRQRDPKPRSIYAAWMHGLIFYGFFALVFGTTIVALKDYHIVDLYHGWFYAFTKVTCQVGGVALAIGLLLGIFRRSDKNLKFSHSLGYTLLYTFLFLLVLQGFFLQGFRLAFDQMATDKQWGFVGYLFSYLYPKNMAPENANMLYTAMWYFHMLTTMAFIATIPYTRALHIVTASLNLYTQRLTPAVMLAKMDFENAEAEYFGARDIRDFTWKDLLSFDSCTECRRCTDICPANAVLKPLDPREIILKMKNSMTVEALFPKQGEEENYFLFLNLFHAGQVVLKRH